MKLRLSATQQAAYGILRDRLEADRWQLAGKYSTERYIQRSSRAASRRASIGKFLKDMTESKPAPIAGKQKGRIIAVTAEGGLVTVAWVVEHKDPKNPAKTYASTWFDIWFMKDT